MSWLPMPAGPIHKRKANLIRNLIMECLPRSSSIMKNKTHRPRDFLDSFLKPTKMVARFLRCEHRCDSQPSTPGGRERRHYPPPGPPKEISSERFGGELSGQVKPVFVRVRTFKR